VERRDEGIQVVLQIQSVLVAARKDKTMRRIRNASPSLAGDHYEITESILSWL
jgi:hypothetical protein